VGLYFINPSMEYLSSGPFHFELTGHLDDGDGGDPTLLDYWRGTHYGGSELPVAANEDWNKVVGPIFIYLGSGPTPDAMFVEGCRLSAGGAAGDGTGSDDPEGSGDAGRDAAEPDGWACGAR
jgi:hypothetical protein